MVNIIDLRVDKKWYFKKWSLELYYDIQNVTSSSVSNEVLILDRPVDESGQPIGGGVIENPDDPLPLQKYKLKTIDDAIGTIIPSLGIVISI